MEFAELCSYSVIVFYDEDGTAAANLYTILHRAFNRLRDMQVKRFPHPRKMCISKMRCCI